MGVRLYDPNTGHFLSTDPIYGGNANPYIYPADPIGASDSTGKDIESFLRGNGASYPGPWDGDGDAGMVSRPRGGHSAAARNGVCAHTARTYPRGYTKEKSLGGGNRPDATDSRRKSIIELKPDTPSGRRAGVRQMRRYLSYANEFHRGGWTGRVEYYDPHVKYCHWWNRRRQKMTVLHTQIKALIGNELKAMGCHKEGTRWCRSQAGVGLSVSFYKMRGRDQLRIEIGVETRDEFQSECRRSDEAAIMLNADDLRMICRDSSVKAFDDLLDFENSIADEIRLKEVFRGVQEILIPGLRKVTNRSFLRSPEASELLQSVIVATNAGI